MRVRTGHVSCTRDTKQSKYLIGNQAVKNGKEGTENTGWIVLRRICTEKRSQDTVSQLEDDDFYAPFSSNRQRLSYDVLSGGKRGDYQNCSALYCVLKVVHSHKHT